MIVQDQELLFNIQLELQVSPLKNITTYIVLELTASLENLSTTITSNTPASYRTVATTPTTVPQEIPQFQPGRTRQESRDYASKESEAPAGNTRASTRSKGKKK